MGENTADTRTAGTLVRQWKDLQSVKVALIKEGTLTGAATLSDVIAALRKQLPIEHYTRITAASK